MKLALRTPASLTQISDASIQVAGGWTAFDMGDIMTKFDTLRLAPASTQIDASAVKAMDTAGAWALQRLLIKLYGKADTSNLSGLKPEFATRLDAMLVAFADANGKAPTLPISQHAFLTRVGLSTKAAVEEGLALLSFVGETATTFAASILHPKRIRWRSILFNVRSAGFDALPIVGLLAFLLGIVVAYQGADQLKNYGANIFVVDLVAVSMLREFAPLIAAIIIAGRSGSAYAAQIGTMTVTEEIDAMRTLGIAPIEMLVLPKLIGLMIALPLLTVFADALGLVGGMIMAREKLGVGYSEFIERLVKAIEMTTYTTGIGKAPVFAFIIVLIGCFQGFRTKGGADSVGRQTTRSVVQAVFLVIVADALFSVVFSALDL
jgi:phospholipid/cholesterol/gamma-HCH transport system permease protein